MPLIQCPDCGVDVSDLAPACARCGRPMATLAPPSAPPATGSTGGNVIASLASLCIPGLGQLTQGRIGPALAFFFAAFFAWFLLLGWIFHFWAACDSAVYREW